jgi:hypothetical protein
MIALIRINSGYRPGRPSQGPAGEILPAPFPEKETSVKKNKLPHQELLGLQKPELTVLMELAMGAPLAA